MLDVKDKGRLFQIIKHCLKIEKKMSDVTLEDFEDDEDLREIICFNIFQIGELAKGLTIELTKKYNEVPWKEIKGMRDVIGHGYGTIDVEIVYNTTKDNISVLSKYCEKILEDNGI